MSRFWKAVPDLDGADCVFSAVAGSFGLAHGLLPARHMTHRILVLDDEEAILFALQEFFSACGYDVHTARELADAKALVASAPYDLVIADLRLSGTHGAEGLELVGLIREQYPSTRTVLLTAYGSPEMEAEARRRGVDAFLHKPKPLPELAQIVLALLSQA